MFVSAVESEVLPDQRIRRAVTLFRELISYHPGLFFTSMAGATVYALCTVASSWALQWVIDRVVLPRFEEGSVPTRTLLLGLLLLVVLAIVRASGVILRRTWAGKAQWRTAESITGEVVASLVAQPVSWHRRQSPGELVARAGVDVDAMVAVMAPLPYASSVVLMMVVAGIGLILNDLVLGLLAIAVFPVLIVANVMYQRRVDRWYDIAQQELGSLSAAAHESFEGVSVVKAFGAENRETERLATIAARVRAARVEAIGLRSLFESVLDVVPNLANVGIVALGAHRVNAGELTIGGLASFIYLFTLLVFPLRILGYALSELPRSLAGQSRIRSLTNQVVESDPRESFDRVPGGSVATDEVLGADDVSVAHVEESPVVTGVSFSVRAGTLTVLVGTTGSGKTTLLEALAGLIPISSGSIRARSTSMALVFQEPFLLGASVLDNVTMGRASSPADVSWALTVADADFVEDLPQGLATVVGERGVGLSGGQRQRLALARAVLGRPAVLFLDDTTSALDPRTEARVLANLRNALPATAIVAVASRPSLIRMSDRVLFLESGRILADGPHDQLMLTSAPFAVLMDAYDEDRDSGE